MQKSHKVAKAGVSFEFKKYYRISKSGCWLWLHYVNASGYGYWTKLINGRRHLAHRVMYESRYGKIPTNLQLDHLCRNRRCVNPDHLEPVTARENILRGVGLAAKNAAKKICKRGHKLSGRNIYNCRGARHCRSCRRLWDRAIARGTKP